MERSKMKKQLILCVGLLLLAMPAFAFNAENFDFGGHIRMRGYDFNNFLTFDDQSDGDNWSVFRHRTSLWARINAGAGVTGFIKITNQNYGEGVTYAEQWEADNESNKLFVDNAFINIDSFSNLPVNLRFGRQDLRYGSGFVLFDGQSQFGSTAAYFGGVKLSLDLGENARLDALYFKDQEYVRSDDDGDDITLSGLYLIGHCPVLQGQQEVYLLNRNDETIDKDIWMPGLRLSNTYSWGLDYSAEIAWQFGDAFEEAGVTIDQDALGCKLDLGFTFKDTATSPRLFLGYVYMSGDEDDNDDESNRWDVFYGGWPQFGDLLVWKYLNTGPGNSITDYDSDYNELSSTAAESVYSNLIITTAGVGLNLTEKLRAKVSYSLLTVDEADPGADDEFGDYYQLKAEYHYSDALTFAVYAAMIDPGDAFVNDDTAHELFWETKLAF